MPCCTEPSRFALSSSSSAGGATATSSRAACLLAAAVPRFVGDEVRLRRRPRLLARICTPRLPCRSSRGALGATIRALASPIARLRRRSQWTSPGSIARFPSGRATRPQPATRAHQPSSPSLSILLAPRPPRIVAPPRFCIGRQRCAPPFPPLCSPTARLQFPLHPAVRPPLPPRPSSVASIARRQSWRE